MDWQLVIRIVALVALVAFIAVMVLNALRGSHTRRLYVPGAPGGVAPPGPPAGTPPTTPPAAGTPAAGTTPTPSRWSKFRRYTPTWLLILLMLPIGAAVYHFVVAGGRLPTSWPSWLTGITLPSALMVTNVAIAIFITACFAGAIYNLIKGKWMLAIALFVLMGGGPPVYIYVLEQFWRPTTTTVATAPPRTTAAPITVTTLPGDAQCVGTLPARTIGSNWTVINPSGRCTVEFTVEPGKCIEFKNAFNQVVGSPFCKPTSGPAVAPLLYPKNIESIRAFNSGSAQVIVGLFTPPR